MKKIDHNIENSNFENSEFFQNFKKEKLFFVPDDYFENLHASISGKCNQNKSYLLKNIFTYLFLRPAFSVSMVITAIAFFFGLFYIIKNNKSSNLIIANKEYTEKSIADYLIENENIDDLFIMDAITEDTAYNENFFVEPEEIANPSGQVKISESSGANKSDTTLSQEEIFNYFIEENIDPNNL